MLVNLPLYDAGNLARGNLDPRHLDKELTSDQKNDIRIRSKELGISKLINCETGNIHEDQEKSKVRLTDVAMLKKAQKLSTPFFVDKNDVKNAIDFLELFAVHVDNSKESRKSFGEEYIDNKCHKALVRLELLRSQLSLTKSALKPTVKLLKGNLAKLIEATPMSEKGELSEKVEMAQNILKRYVS